MKRITLRQIAKEANVHVTTVSLALRNSTKLPASTRERIQTLAKSMGYCPDPMLTALNAYRNGVIKPKYQATFGWINNYPVREDLYRVKLFKDYFDGAKQHAEELGYGLEEFWLPEPGMTKRRLDQIFRTRRIEGLLIAPQPHANAELDLNWSSVSAISMSESLVSPRLHTFAPHQYRSMQIILHNLRELGYQRIGLLLSIEYDNRCDNNWQARFWVDYHAQEPSRRVPALLHEGNVVDGKTLKSWYQKYRPDVIIAQEQPNIDRVYELGLKIPEELGVTTLGSSRATSFGSVAEQGTAMGAAAIDFLIAMRHRGEKGLPDFPQRIRFEGLWQSGTTLRRVESQPNPTVRP